MKVRKTKPIIAIDIDDVLADNAASFIEFSNQTWGMTLKRDDYHEHWPELWGVDEKEAEERATLFNHSGAIARYAHIESALEVLRRLSNDYELRIVTARREHSRDETVSWLHEHYTGIFSEDKIHFAGIWDDGITYEKANITKAAVIAELGATYLIDDQVKHCKGVVDAGQKALLFGNYTWNTVDELPDGITRVDGWLAVERFFYGE